MDAMGRKVVLCCAAIEGAEQWLCTCSTSTNKAKYQKLNTRSKL